ncbi:ORF37 [macacine gammaherpesvirus 12]|uniref:ORF37 n=1 Tax=macacine gammaherpesvirus 12 TaxID=2560571 RepID=A0A0B5CYU1_9GAMA|nr:ORF37 [Macaca nemestrina rhadinovirus 2]AJE29680.1 ORF37 [Macaca nemestrina rhadinovirus 2]
MDFFSDKPMVQEMALLDIDEQQRLISKMSLANFLRHDCVRAFFDEAKRGISMPAMRFVYNFYLFAKVGDFIGNTDVYDFYITKVFKGRRLTLLADVYDACLNMHPHDRHHVCALIEQVTRGQNINPLWDALRDGIISSSKFHWAIKQQNSSKKIFNPWPIVNNHFVAGPLAFGLRCEEVVKKILATLLHPGEAHCEDYGFMQSPLNGVFGVSLDFGINVRSDPKDGLEFHPDCKIYEIKCRFKYTFSKMECDPIYAAYVKLYQKPSMQTLKGFLYSIAKPAIEFVGEDKLPSESDYLVAYDKEWEVCPRKKRRLTAVHHLVKKCMIHNSTAPSDVYILSDPQETGGQINIKAHLRANLFVNVRHSYYYQVLLQSLVVQEYISLSKGTKNLGTQKNFIATGFFRKRQFEDPSNCTIGEFTPLDPHVEIPTLLIVTPVYFPSVAKHQLVKQATEFWSASAREAFPELPWDLSSLCANAPPTP